MASARGERQMFPRQTNSTFFLSINQNLNKNALTAHNSLKNVGKIRVGRVTKEQQVLFIGACITFFKVLPFDLKSLPLLLRRGLFSF
jgi:hypothetical protein